MNVVDRLRELVAIDSQVTKENTSVIELIQSWFTGYDTEVQDWQRPDGVKGKNCIVKIPGKISDQATVFICHLDTVPTSSQWKTDPFTLTESDEKLYGLGACDVKGGIAALIEAVLVNSEKPARDIYLVFDGDEESMGIGIETFIHSMNIAHPQFIAIEPTDGNVLIMQRSIVKLKITTHGVSQHSSKATPELNDSDNAIHKMAKVMMTLEKDAKNLSKERDELLGTHTQNFGVISGGTASNVIPDSCILFMHRRLLPKRDVGKEKEYIEKLLLPVDPTVTVELVGSVEPGFSTSKESSLVKNVLTIAQKYLPKTKLDAFLAWSEAGMTSSKGDSLILGPGSIHLAHNANEFIAKDDLSRFVTIYRDIINSVVA